MRFDYRETLQTHPRRQRHVGNPGMIQPTAAGLPASSPFLKQVLASVGQSRQITGCDKGLGKQLMKLHLIGLVNDFSRWPTCGASSTSQASSAIIIRGCPGIRRTYRLGLFSRASISAIRCSTA